MAFTQSLDIAIVKIILDKHAKSKCGKKVHWTKYSEKSWHLKNIVSCNSYWRWSANQTIGPPKVYPQHGDIHGAWASAAIDKHQFIEVKSTLFSAKSIIHHHRLRNILFISRLSFHPFCYSKRKKKRFSLDWEGWYAIFMNLLLHLIS